MELVCGLGGVNKCNFSELFGVGGGGGTQFCDLCCSRSLLFGLCAVTLIGLVSVIFGTLRACVRPCVLLVSFLSFIIVVAIIVQLFSSDGCWSSVSLALSVIAKGWRCMPSMCPSSIPGYHRMAIRATFTPAIIMFGWFPRVCLPPRRLVGSVEPMLVLSKR
jgi:hypothetical protein